MKPDELRELMALEEKATPGPWRYIHGEFNNASGGLQSGSIVSGEDYDCWYIAAIEGDCVGAPANRELISAMRNHFAALCRLALAARALSEWGTTQTGNDFDAALAAVFGEDSQ